MKFWIACLTVLFVALLIWLAFSREFSKAITDFTNPTTEEPAPTGPGDKRVFGTCQDVQGNIYPTIAIGNQVWMADNLRNTTTACGDSLSLKFVDGLERGPGVKLGIVVSMPCWPEGLTTLAPCSEGSSSSGGLLPWRPLSERLRRMPWRFLVQAKSKSKGTTHGWGLTCVVCGISIQRIP